MMYEIYDSRNGSIVMAEIDHYYCGQPVVLIDGEEEITEECFVDSDGNRVSVCQSRGCDYCDCNCMGCRYSEENSQCRRLLCI